MTDIIISSADQEAYSQEKITARTVVCIEDFSSPFLELVLRSTAHALKKLTSGLRKSLFSGGL